MPAVRRRKVELRVSRLKPNHKHTPMAMDFYLAVCGDDELPPTGIEVARETFDAFGVERQMLPLADVPRHDPRYNKAQDYRDKLRKMINSGACCIDVPSNRQFRVEVNRGRWMMIPASDLARTKLQGLGDTAIRKLKPSFDEIERIITVQTLTALSEIERQKYQLALQEISYVRTAFVAFEANLSARGRNIAGVLPGRE